MGVLEITHEERVVVDHLFLAVFLDEEGVVGVVLD